MENISILRPDYNNRSIVFKFTNATDVNRDIYISDVTLYTFLRNIDWVNNTFSWVELRDVPAENMVVNPSDYPNATISNVPILCCARIPPGTYKNTETLISVLNDILTENSDINLSSITVNHGVPGSTYDISSITITRNDSIVWYPAVIDSPIIHNGFDIALTNQHNHEHPSNCIPTLVYNQQADTISLPSPASPYNNNLLLYNADISAKLDGLALTSHALSFMDGITAALTIDAISIDVDDLYESEYGMIRLKENGDNYSEFILNPSDVQLINIVKEKYNSIPTEEGTTTDDITPILFTFDCVSYPFFPTSEKLFVRCCNTDYIDKLVESRMSSDRIFGSTLAHVNVSTEWKPSTSSSGTNDTLDISSVIYPLTIPINTVITIPKNSVRYIYVTGDKHRYPLWRSAHTLKYRIVG